jgi:hypothetical protein
MNIPYEKLPLVNLNALKVESHRSRAGKTPSEESVNQDNKDAEKVMSLVEMDGRVSPDDMVEPDEKYMTETMPGKTSKSVSLGVGGMRKPHYTRLLALDNKMVFQAACCLPLRVIAANLDGDTVSGRVLYSAHSDEEGGKLVYEFQGEGSELIIDIKRGDSSKAQRLIFNV